MPRCRALVDHQTIHVPCLSRIGRGRAAGLPRRPPHRSGLALLTHPAPASSRTSTQTNPDAVRASQLLANRVVMSGRADRSFNLRFRQALCPDHGVIADLPLCQGPSLHQFRRRHHDVFVHRLPHYYGLVRFPGCLPIELWLLTFLDSTRPWAAIRTSQVPTKHIHTCTGSTTPENPVATRMIATTDFAFPLRRQGQRSQSLISELDTEPIYSPVNA